MNPSQSILKCGLCNHREEKGETMWCVFHDHELQLWNDGARDLFTVDTVRIGNCKEINLFNYKDIAFIEELKRRKNGH